MVHDFDDDFGSVSEAFKILATLFMSEPDISVVEGFKETFVIESSALPGDVVDDFYALFYGGRGCLNPLESAYISQTGLPVLTDNVMESLYNFYIREGLIMDETIHIPPDHISAELFFISYLVESGRSDSLRSFLEEHAVLWIPQFCDDLHEKASTDFYKEVASITKDMVLSEYEQLSDWQG